MTDVAIITRAATRDDDQALAQLATLHDRHRPSGQLLVAEANGTVIAAITLTSGAVLAAPACLNTHAIHALRHRRYRLLRQGGDLGPAWLVARRLGRPSLATS